MTTHKHQNRRAPAELRLSQVLTTYGPGAMVDLPTRSVIIGGLNHWHGDRKSIDEERLANRVAEVLGVPEVTLYSPPIQSQDATATGAGITSFTFPGWFVAQVDELWKDRSGRAYRTRPLLPWGQLVEKGKYLDRDRKKQPVVPVRFVQACIHGHISDISWSWFVHADRPGSCRGQLWLDEGGSGSDFSDIYVRCDACAARRPLSQAMALNALGQCRGERPWLGPKASELCVSVKDKPAPNRLLVRTASNAYFSQTLSVISIPDANQKVRDGVSRIWEDFLQYAESKDEVAKERRKQKVTNALHGLTDEQVWAEIQRRKKGGSDLGRKSIKQVEMETLLSSPETIGEDKPDERFYARTRKLQNPSKLLAERIERVVLIHRLREVIAQVGFTRFESSMPDINGDLELGVSRAALGLETNWVPAIENKGEGVFIAFKSSAIKAWLEREAVKKRGKQLAQGFQNWMQRRGITEAKFPGLPYLMLHSLSHLLITAVSLDCGYSATSIRERVYANEEYGYGILLYTGSSGSEGTLGGLVQVGDRLEEHMQAALELGQLCSNDPVCSQHDPSLVQEERFLHGSACHGCLLIAEPSCEQGNEYLDRALVVPTVAGLGAEFFLMGTP